jgi:opacity protein-like surface antigen
MRRFALAVALIVLVAHPAFAQQKAWRDADLSAGYSFLRDQTNETSSHGWFASANLNVASRIGIMGEFAGNYGSGDDLQAETHIHAHSFMAGPKFAFQVLDAARVSGGIHVPYFTSFAYGLLGGVRVTDYFGGPDNTDTDFAVTVGAGTDFWLFPNGSIRLAVDYRRVFSDPGANQFRFIAGLAVGSAFRPH